MPLELWNNALFSPTHSVVLMATTETVLTLHRKRSDFQLLLPTAVLPTPLKLIRSVSGSWNRLDSKLIRKRLRLHQFGTIRMTARPAADDDDDNGVGVAPGARGRRGGGGGGVNNTLDDDNDYKIKRGSYGLNC